MVKQILKEMTKLSPVMMFGMKILDKEEFGEDGYGSNGSQFYYIVMLLISMVAIYLSFKCYGRFDLGEFILALLCSPLYIAYRLAVPCVKAVM
jgi:hypothetical protein